ncbi:TrkA family potassium uptake protein [Agromyces sp. SYSU K20354]|uniref:potassium channel family protein n=1 Tax=Agromyces cavernae TaxID=2898659 RepID=UPI001E5F32F6|nr:TrkA family potassium uptake protein [Agromyces cavernae]MCD2440700.1 TrkA family potassium uptake protein [Agromyces cavernae]
MARFAIFAADTSRRIAEADSVAVIGLGRFGSSLALELMAGGTEVLGIDVDEDLVQALNGQLTQVVRADSTKEEALRQLAVHEFDRVVVAIGDDISASILTCSVLLSLKIPVIWAKVGDERHGLILEQLGVHHVIYPEQEMGRKVAHLVRGAAQDYVEVERGYVVVKSSPPARLCGIPLGKTGLRKEFGVTVAAYKKPGAEWTNADADTVLGVDDTILIVGPTRKAEGFAQLR